MRLHGTRSGSWGMLQRPLGSSTPKTRSPPPPLSSAQGARQGKIKSVNAIGQGEGGGRARLHTWWGSSEATATATCAKNEPVAMGGHLCEPRGGHTVQRHARGVLRAGGNAGRPGQSSGAVFHYDYTARRFFYMAALPNKQRRSTKEQLQAHDEVGGSCSAPKTAALPKPVLRLRGSAAPFWPHRSAPRVQQRQVAPEARAALLPRGGGAFTRISTLFSGP